MNITRRDVNECFKIFEILLIIIVIPTLVFFLLAQRWPTVLNISYTFLVTILVFQASLTYLQTTIVLKRKRFKELSTAEHIPLPKTTFIVVAYLPNEVSVIETTLLNILQNVQRPKDGIEVILVYNTPHLEELELKLRELALKWPELILANAYGSHGKSENLNYALDMVSGKMIVLLDADHMVASDCLQRAWRWLDEGYDIVQGTCKIRNGKESLISRVVEIEFETIYIIHHAAKSILFNSTLFGGSNGYWKSDVIKKIKFDKEMLTEDIDSTIRALLGGYHIVHDRSIVSQEKAPTTIKNLWYQRKRWSQGWFQCSLKYQIATWKNKYLNFPQKFLWTTLLSWRVTYDILSTLIFPVLFAFWLYRAKVELPLNGYIIFALIYTLFSGPYQVIASYKNTSIPRTSAFWYINYAIFVWPHTIFKSMAHLVAIRDEIMGDKKWIATTREKNEN